MLLSKRPEMFLLNGWPLILVGLQVVIFKDLMIINILICVL